MIEITEEAVQRLFGFMKERHAIYIRRQRGDPWPWTNDEILQTYKFCNIFRELDTGTIFCREKIREPYADDPDLAFNIAMYRLFNFAPTFEAIGYVNWWYHSKKQGRKVDHNILIHDLLYKRHKQGLQIFTGAHMITGTLGGDKIHQVFDICLTDLWDKRLDWIPTQNDTLESAFNKLNGKIHGFGPFIAYEVITDLRYTRYLDKATDIMTWANPGPGCRRGINRLCNLPLKQGVQMSDWQYLWIMQELLRISKDYLPGWMPALEMREIEHSCCEYDKYERTRLGEGRPRSRFVPPHLR